MCLLGLVLQACGGDDGEKTGGEAGGEEVITSDGEADADAAPPSDADDSHDAEPDAPPASEGCTPGLKTCADKQTQRLCRPDGSGWDELPCAVGTACVEGQCQLLKCNPGEETGKCATPSAFEVCNGTGTDIELHYCDVKLPTCVAGKCTDLKCQPGAKQCKGPGAVEQCKDDGTGFEVSELCGDGHLCKNNVCVTACDANVKENTYIGCEYWAVDLDNIEAGQFQNLAVVVSNPSETDTATVTITNFSTSTDLDLPTQAVPPLGQQLFELPKGHDLNGSVMTNKTFRIKSTKPVIVHQFNPRNAEDVYSNDASLLLPTNVAGKEFIVHSWPQRQADSKTYIIPVRGFVTLVAVDKGTTTVTLLPTANIEPGEGVPPMAAYTPSTLTLEYGHVVQLETGGGASGPDLTGTYIVADKRISVFGGHECANVPLIIEDGVFKGVEYCDHVEQQLVPLENWGKEYVADAFAPRSPDQKDVWRILSGADNVELTIDPPIAGVDGASLDKAAFVQFESAGSFHILATGPISVAHFLTGSNHPGFTPVPECAKLDAQTGIGDPAMTLAVATEQQRDDYIVLTPADYVKNYLNFSYQTGTTLTLDGTPVDLPVAPVGGSTWNVHSLEVAAGVHHVKGSAPFALTAYGYDCDVSYAYPGGLNLSTQITP